MPTFYMFLTPSIDLLAEERAKVYRTIKEVRWWRTQYLRVKRELRVNLYANISILEQRRDLKTNQLIENSKYTFLICQQKFQFFRELTFSDIFSKMYKKIWNEMNQKFSKEIVVSKAIKLWHSLHSICNFINFLYNVAIHFLTV